MFIGTSYFRSLPDAVKYYKPYGENTTSVKYKIKMGEIHIGRPKIKNNEHLLLNKEEGRYFIYPKTSNLPIIYDSPNFIIIE